MQTSVTTTRRFFSLYQCDWYTKIGMCAANSEKDWLLAVHLHVMLWCFFNYIWDLQDKPHQVYVFFQLYFLKQRININTN